MAGAGYDIGVSASTANSTPQNQSAATVFNFNSPGTSFDGGTQTAYGPATAVASTKSPGSQQSVENPGLNPNSRNPDVSGLQFSGFGINPDIATYAIIGLVVIGAGIFLLRMNR